MIAGPIKCNVHGACNALTTSPDGYKVAVGGRDVFKGVRIEEEGTFSDDVCNMRTAKANNNYNVQDIQWHPTNENLLATAATNGVVVTWDPETRRKEVFPRDHSRQVSRVCWHPTHESLL